MNDTKPQTSVPLFYFGSLKYLNEYLPNHGSSEHTIRSYRKALKLFHDFICTKGFTINTFHFSDCSREILYSFMEWLKANGSGEKTANGRLAAIKAYVKFAVEEDLSLFSYQATIKSVRPFKVCIKENPTLTKEQIELIVSKAPKTKKGYRDRVIMLTLYETAIRVSELLALKLEDLHLKGSSPYVKINGKGKKQRLISLTSQMASCLKEYIQAFHGKDSPQFDGLFYSVTNGIPATISDRQIRNLLTKYAALARVDDPQIPMKIHPHLFRRSRGTNLYQNGLDLTVVSAMLGHEQIETTRTYYARPSMEMMREAMEKSAPNAGNETPNWHGKEEELAQLFGI